MILLAGLKETLMLKSKNNATITAIVKIFIPVSLLRKPICGNSNSITAPTILPIMINGFLLPPMNQLLSLIFPTMGCAIMPDKGPANQTRDTSSICKLYLVLNIQLSVATCVEKQNPTAVAGKLISA